MMENMVEKVVVVLPCVLWYLYGTYVEGTTIYKELDSCATFMLL